MNTQTETHRQRVTDLQIELEELEGAAKLAGNHCDDVELSGTFGVIERRARAIRRSMDDLREAPDKLPTFESLDDIPDDSQRVAAGKSTGKREDADAPSQALAVLFEANDLLNMFRQYSEDSQGQKLTSGEWTLTEEISRRINRAVALLDGAVPHPADAPEQKPKASGDPRDREIPQYIGVGNDSQKHSLDHLAAIKHRKRLSKAESNLWKAQNLLTVLDEYLRHQVESDECIHASHLVEQVEKSVNKAAERIDRFGIEHSNLFIAYCEAKRGGAE